MRILYLSESMLASDGADSVHVMRMASAMQRIGHDVILWGWRGDLEDSEIHAHYGIDRALHVIRADIADRQLRDDAAGGFGPLTRARWLATRLWDERAAIQEVIAEHRPDLVYARNLLALAWVPRDIPVVLETHRPPLDRLRRTLERRLLAGRVRRLVVISDALRGRYQAVLPDLRADVLVAHDAADDPLVDGQQTAILGPAGRGVLRIGHVGHLYAGRGGELLIEVARRLPSIELHFVGGTPGDVARLLALAADLPNVHLHGHRPPSELPRWYASFDVLVAPYQRAVAVRGGAGDTSGFMSPMKLFEYLAWGRPIVFSDLPVLREVLEDRRNALLVAPDDVAAWTAAIQLLQDDPELAARIGAAARADFLASYTWDLRAARVLGDLDGVGTS